MTSPIPSSKSAVQAHSAGPHPQQATRGGISGALGIVTSLALALVSLVVWADAHEHNPQADAAHAAVKATGANAQVPVYVTDPKGEELVWRSGGKVALLPPWQKRPQATTFVALARDSSLLPPTRPEPDSGELSERPPWVARSYGDSGTLNNAPRLIDALSEAKVSISSPKGHTRPCTRWQAQSWHCGPNAWNRVGPERLTINGQHETCLWLHPSDEGDLVITWHDVEAPATLEGRIALSDQAAMTPEGATIQLAVEVNGELALKRAHPNQRGWSSIRAPIEPADDAPGASVTLRVAAAQTGRRHFCMDARITREEPNP